jgi:uncharacterized surface protein with fasciclin (FAS1) repeats
MTRTALIAIIAALTIAPATVSAQSCGATAMTAHHASQPKPSIVETAIGAGDFNTLVAAVKAAGLVEALEGDGPFTVFAPSDAAFGRLPEGTVESLLKPENRERLTAILTYHVVPGNWKASDVVKSKGYESLNGQRLPVKAWGEGVTIAGANIAKTDIMCRNGIIHVIDKVMIPSDLDLVQTAKKAGVFNVLLTAAKAAGLADALAGDDALTVFAPTDKAFASLPAGTVESLLEPQNKEKLVAILKYHVATGRQYSDEVVAAGRVRTLQGASFPVMVKDGAATAGGAKIVEADVDTSNGVIHVIDTVLLPK